MRRLLMISLVSVLPSAASHAQGLHAVRPLPGYICMQLVLTPQQLTDPNSGVPVRLSPSRSAPSAGFAATNVIVEDPPRATAGFLRVLRPNGEYGWIEARQLQPWSNPSAPAARCVPSVMSNGKPGFGSGS